jgi:RNA polymerase sigma-70 factor (ECF subfamily)
MELMEIGEQSLIARAQAGDRAAFADLLARHRKPLLYVIRSRSGPLLRQSADPEDLLQEAALRGFQALGRFRWGGEGSFFRWLSSIALHVLKDQVRRDERHPRAALDHDPPGEGPSPSQLVRRGERLDRLEEALEGLSPDHRQVIHLARFEGLRTSEIARRMNRSPGAVRHLLLRALGRLRDLFGDTESLSLPEEGLPSEEASSHGEP